MGDSYLDTALYTNSATFARALINRTDWRSEGQSPLLLGAFTIVEYSVSLSWTLTETLSSIRCTLRGRLLNTWLVYRRHVDMMVSYGI